MTRVMETKARQELLRLRRRVEALEQTSGDLCPKCGWSGVRPDGCAFCRADLAEANYATLYADCERIEKAFYKAAAELAEAQLIIMRLVSRRGGDRRRGRARRPKGA